MTAVWGSPTALSWSSQQLEPVLGPQRRPTTRQPNAPFDAVDFEGAGVKLEGWWFHAGKPRGTVVFLHGVSDNRGTSVGIANILVQRGWIDRAFVDAAFDPHSRQPAYKACAVNLTRVGQID